MKTLPLPEIIARLCALNACNEPLAQAFVTEFSALVTAALTESGTLHVKGLGTFRKIELGDEVTVRVYREGEYLEMTMIMMAES